MSSHSARSMGQVTPLRLPNIRVDSDQSCLLTQLVADLQLHQIELEAQNQALRDAKAELEESRNRYMELYELSPVGYLTLDRWGRISEINLTAAVMLGELRSALIGTPFTHRICGPDLPKLLDHLLRCRSAGSQERVITRLEVISTCGGTRIIELSSYGSVSPESKEAFLSVMQDITDRVRAEELIHEQREKLMQSSKLSALGEMAAGIVHEINNPLAIIHGNASRLKSACEDGRLDRTLVEKSTDRIEATAMRIAKIIRGLRAFTRKADEDPFEVTSLQLIIEDTLAFCRHRFSNRGVSLSISVPEEIELECRPTEISQVILNLINNAYDAIEHQADKWIRIDADVDGKWIDISVTDSGEGIPPSVRERVFDPFFTTKSSGTGMGLGLSISHGILQRHGGTLDVDAECPNTRFRLRLPLRQEDAF